jgi:hypothetical protein
MLRGPRSSYYWLPRNLSNHVDRQARTRDTEAKEKYDVWDPMPEFTLTSLYVHSLVDSSTFTLGNPMPEPNLSSTLQRKSPLYILFLGIARPQPQFQHSYVCERFI